MVFVKVRETYDLETVPNKMTVIGIHTPKPDIIKANFPGLLLQCKAYRPHHCDVKVACASTQALDPLGVGTTEGAVAPEDMFNPILYKAISNVGMSQLEARILQTSLSDSVTRDVVGQSADVDVDTLTAESDEFPIYYGILSNAHGWKAADPQSGLVMTGLRPLVFEMLWNFADQNRVWTESDITSGRLNFPAQNGNASSNSIIPSAVRGNAKPLPFMNCTAYSSNFAYNPMEARNADPHVLPSNHEVDMPYINCVCGCIIIPPSRLHTLFFRMIVEWTLEFTEVRPIGEITDWAGLNNIANVSHFQNYSYSETKKALTGTDETILDNDQCMVSSNVEIKKVM